MSDSSLHLLIGLYEDEETGKAQFKRLTEDRKHGALDFEAAAVVGRGADDKLHIHETDDMGAGRGAAVGGAIGAAIGLLAGPAGVVAGGALGAYFGGLAAGSVDSGVPNTTLAEIGAMIEPGSAAVVALVTDTWRDDVHVWLENSGASMADTNPTDDADDADSDNETDDDSSESDELDETKDSAETEE
ncbi:MAG: DUF1269 domain-containing protein [Caldilineales bacterium]|nr:DUF1269 domain-containing protein [Caldilineales bacterium]